MGVRSKRLFGPLIVTTSAATIYTCPAGETAILKHLGIMNGNGGSEVFVLTLGAQIEENYLGYYDIPAAGTTNFVPWFVVLHPGDELVAATGANNLTVTGYGAELEGVAD